jgi:hypothetical protein
VARAFRTPTITKVVAGGALLHILSWRNAVSVAFRFDKLDGCFMSMNHMKAARIVGYHAPIVSPPRSVILPANLQRCLFLQVAKV